MVISSIDLKDGKVAVIDLDAALGNINEKGETPNTDFLDELTAPLSALKHH